MKKNRWKVGREWDGSEQGKWYGPMISGCEDLKRSNIIFNYCGEVGSDVVALVVVMEEKERRGGEGYKW